MLETRLFIDGKWQRGKGGIRRIVNPADCSPLAEVAEADEEQVDEAVRAAKRAFRETTWKKDTALRVEALRKIADLLERSQEEFARLESMNTGKPLRESRIDVSDSVACLRYYASLVEKREPWEKEMPDGTTSRIIDEPIGVCGLIVPWNFPLLLGIWKVAPALAAGNTVVFKPSEWTPLTMLKFCELLKAVGLPEGVFNLVLGDGRAGGRIVAHPDVDKISFTGGSATGRRIYEECARSLKRVSLELGGKSPLLVFADADLHAAVDWALFGAFFNQGQVCVASSRLLVQRKIFPSFVEALRERSQRLRIGDPLDEKTEMGPLVSEAHLKKVMSYIELGKREGAQLLAGGTRIGGWPGYFLTPTVFVDVRQSMRIVQEEIFGPVVVVQAFAEEQEAIALANGTPYGLAAGILTRDLERARRVSRELQAGTVWINGYHTPYVEAPWGGFKQSGIGRELGPHGLAAFTEPKHVNERAVLQPSGWFAN
ncbi:aldehyde dehydrogenase family protein [Bacillaceae bacterium]